MKKRAVLFEIGLVLLILFVYLIPKSSYAYDLRLDKGLIPDFLIGVPGDILSVLKENYPILLINDTEFAMTIDQNQKPVYKWSFGFADLDGIGDNNYLVVVYNNVTFNSLIILKREAGMYKKVWECPFDPDGSIVNFVDLNNDSKPEIVIDSSGGATGRGYCENIFSWTGSEAKLLISYLTEEKKIYIGPNSYITRLFIKENDPICGRAIYYYDLDRDGKLEVIAAVPAYDADGNEIGETLKIYKWQDSEGIVYKEELQTSPFITASIKVKSDKWNLRWIRERKDRGRKDHVMGESQDKNLSTGKDDDKSEGNIKVYIGNLADGHTVNEVKLNSIRLNEKLAPEGKVKLYNDKDKRDKEEKSFQGKYLIAEFDKNEAIEAIPDLQRGDLKKRDKVNITISGQLNNGKFFIGSCEIELEGK